MSENVRHVLGLSGGKDSAALAVHMDKNYPDIPIEYFFTDTGYELSETYDYLNKLTAQIMSEILDNNKELSFVYSDHFRVDEKSIKQNLVRLKSLENLYLHGAGIMFRRKDILSVGNYDKNLRGAEDHELIMRLIKNNKKSFHIPLPLYRYYIHNQNLTKSQKRKNYIKRFSKF